VIFILGAEAVLDKIKRGEISKEKIEQEGKESRREEQTIHGDYKDSPDFKTGISSLVSPATDTSSHEDSSVTQNSSTS